MSSEEVAIRVDNVSKHYLMFDKPEDRLKQMVMPRLRRLAGRAPRQYFRDFAAVHGVSFEIRRGETVGIIGRNGSGKSTMLQMICGTLQPSSGQIDVHGRVAALLELGAGFNPDFTGRENVYLNAAILGLSRAETDRRFDDIARFADIGLFIDQPVKTYSSGMYVRLAFSVAINVDPDILVVDEALSVGDEAFQRKCFARIEDIREKGGTILFVTHGVQTVVQLCDRAMLFDHGELLLEGRPKLVTGQYQRLANASGERVEEIRTGIRALRQQAVSEQASDGSNGQLQPAVRESLGPSEERSPAGSPTLLVADYLDEHLRSRSMIEMEDRGAIISDARITTLHGDRVNVLSVGKRYNCQYDVTFTRGIRQVGFGFSVKTIAGVALGGVQTARAPQLALPAVTPQTKRSISFSFQCLMRPGTYLVDIGVVSMAESDGTVLGRIQDALMFKVAETYFGGESGLVDLGALLEVSAPQAVATVAP